MQNLSLYHNYGILLFLGGEGAGVIFLDIPIKAVLAESRHFKDADTIACH
jgi:hypothetical protein